MSGIEDALRERAEEGGETYQTPIVTVNVQVKEDIDGITPPRISGRMREIGPGMGVPLEDVTYDRMSNTFVGETTSLVELEDLEAIKQKMENILQAEGLTVEASLVGADVIASSL